MKKFIITSFVFITFISQIFAQQKGDTVTVSGKKLVLTSDNLITNPGFENGFTGWTDATTSAAQLSSSYFTIVSTGGIDNSKYLVGTTNSSSSSAGSIGTGWSIQPGKTYYFSYNVKYLTNVTTVTAEPWLKVSLTNDKTSSSEPYILIDTTWVNAGSAWTQNAVSFTNSSSYTYIVARFRWLSNQFGFDNFALHEASEVVDVAGLQAVIDSAKSLYDASANGAQALQTAIDTAQSKLTSTTAAEIKQAISDLKAAILTYKLANASPQNPVDMTSYITNPSFESSFAGWTNNGMSTQTNSYFPGKDGSIYVEEWVYRGSQVPDVSVQQQLTGLPDGNYTLTATAGNIQQTAAGSSTNNSATPQTGTSLFAGYESVAVDTIKDRSVKFTVVDNQVTIGFKAENATGNWVTCDNFRLSYTGAYGASDYAQYLNGVIGVAQTWLTKKIQNSAIADLNNAISTAQQAINADPLVQDDLTAAKLKLDSVINEAETSLQTYAKLQTEIDYSNKLLGWYSDDSTKTAKLTTAVDTAKVALTNYDLTLNEINQAISRLNLVNKSVDKKIYDPTWMMGNIYDPTNDWSIERSKQSKNWILFWEPGFGDNPGSTVDDCLALAEKCFDFYADSLKFITKGSSKTDTYKMIIRLRYSTDWEATGSGVDNTIGLLTLTPWALTSRGGQTVAHEVGHCFQYQVHCDNNDNNGWMYGYGVNSTGSNGWWEQCAQWQAYKVFPQMQFNNEWFAGYLSHAYKNILNETYRYNDYFIQDYWTYKHGMGEIGLLWNKSYKPEDPVETYKRINGITQSQFNDEMWDCGARFASWDIPALRSYGKSTITARPQPTMTDVGNNYWMIDSTDCPENYGHNIIRLNVTPAGATVTANFVGEAGINGFRKNYLNYAGWRFGFVAMKYDGTRYYSEIKSASMTVNGGKASISFTYPSSCTYLWFVVSGAPSVHWRHAWDDDDSNDEQWPYEVRFGNTNLLGKANVVNAVKNTYNENIAIYSNGDKLYVNEIPSGSVIKVYNLLGSCVLDEKVNSTTFSTTLPSGVYVVAVQTESGLRTQKIVVR